MSAPPPHPASRPRSTFRPPAPTRTPKLNDAGAITVNVSTSDPWNEIEWAIKAQLEALRASTRRLDRISQLLQASSPSHGAIDVVPPAECGVSLRSTAKNGAGPSCKTPVPTSSSSGDSDLTLAPTLQLDDLIDMRQFESDYDGLRPIQGGVGALDKDIALEAEAGENERENEKENEKEIEIEKEMEVDIVSFSPFLVDTRPLENEICHRRPSPIDLSRSRESTPLVSEEVRPATPAILSDEGSATPATLEKTEGSDEMEGRGLRVRRKRPDYVNHPMDLVKRRKRATCPSPARSSSLTVSVSDDLESVDSEGSDDESDDGRYVRGLSTAVVPMLPKSDGVQRGRDWWEPGKNDQHGRLQEIACIVCKGRAHWACAGLERDHDMDGDAWACPDCFPSLQRPDADRPVVEAVQQDRCIRPDCVVRLPIKSGDKDQFPVHSIIGRRVLSLHMSDKRRYEYLVRWEGYELYDATWGLAKSFGVGEGLKALERQFLKKCRAERLNDRARVVLLPEAEWCWDENGDLKEEMLARQGITPAEWWPEPRGKYTVKRA